jgi:hypothetical protein
VLARTSDQPQFRVAAGPLDVPWNSELEVFYAAEAVGPGGAVLASHGSPSSPLRLAPHTDASPPPALPAPQPPKAASRRWIGWVVAGAVVVVGGVVTASVLLRRDSEPLTRIE